MSPRSDQPRANSVCRLRLWPPNGFALFPLLCICVAILGFLWTFFCCSKDTAKLFWAIPPLTRLGYLTSALRCPNHIVSYRIAPGVCRARQWVRDVLSLWRQPSRVNVIARACAVHQQLSCFPRGHNRKSWSIWGQTVYHSQQGHCTKQHKFVASCCLSLPKTLL